MAREYQDNGFESADVGRAALQLALSETRTDENTLRDTLAAQGIRGCAVNFGGKFLDILPKVYESAIVAAQRQNVVSDTHVGDGSVLGAVESAMEQVKVKAIGMNVGGKVGIARWNEHLCVAVYIGVGVLHFNEIAVGIAHRTLRDDT
ncbi:MAG: HutP family protein [Dialister sp.]|nr:HutP family protein [Dialister sp.]